jgi:hypothetical protein
VFGACTIRWAMKVPQPAVQKIRISRTGGSSQHILCVVRGFCHVTSLL